METHHILLNLGCGSKVSALPGVRNLDWSPMVRLRRHPLRAVLVPALVRGERRRRFDALPDNVEAMDLSRGIPYADNSVDAVYHSHFLEHLDRDVAPLFLDEVRRVLKPGGVHRIVVPDLETAARTYIQHLELHAADETDAPEHDEYVATLIEQSVRRHAHGTAQQRPLRRWVENRVLGDARKRGETHQWMYDRINLASLLKRRGYRRVERRCYRSSEIPRWDDYGLDRDEQGGEYRPGSLYMEAMK
jgi:SAM-dependent methyltransferase